LASVYYLWEEVRIAALLPEEVLKTYGGIFFAKTITLCKASGV
jgi:hypothetical protein